MKREIVLAKEEDVRRISDNSYRRAEMTYKQRISKLEKGRNLTYSTLQRVFKALGVTGYVEVAGMGKVPLW